MTAFLFTTCQLGFEPALKRELAREHPGLRFAYSRPGLVTWKVADGPAPDPLRSVFARAWGVSVGARDDVAGILDVARSLRRGRPLRLHVWERDRAVPGEEPPDFGAAAAALDAELRAAGGDLFAAEAVAERGDVVLDVIVAPGEAAWVGHHVASPGHAPWPGGRMPIDVPDDAPSRAYRKLAEALVWSGAKPKPGEVAVDVGAAPGGAALVLLRRGVRVIGVDPADMAPVVAAHAGFTHLRKPIGAVRREELPDAVHWLVVDVSVAPPIALRSIQRLIPPWRATLRGLLLTLKLNDDRMIDQVPDFLRRVRELGAADVRATQLPSNRRELFAYGILRKPGRNVSSRAH